MKTTIEQETDSIVIKVRKLKEENAAAYNYNIRAIGEAAQRHQQNHPERIVNREKKTEPDAGSNPAGRGAPA